MPVKPTYPGVYVQEVPSGSRTITGVSTSVTAFVGYAVRGPVDEPVRIFNFGEFESVFGGLKSGSEMAYAVYQYFQNGGTEALVVRTARDGTESGEEPLRTARVKVDTEDDASEISLSAANAGEWGNRLRVSIDYATQNSRQTSFNLGVTEVVNGEQVRSEEHRNLTITQSRKLEEILEQDSDLLRATVPGGISASTRPAATGTIATVDSSALDNGVFTSGAIDPSEEMVAELDWPGPDSRQKKFTLSGSSSADGQSVGTVLRRLDAGLEEALEEVDGVEGVALERWSGNTYRLTLDSRNPRVTLEFSSPSGGPSDVYENLGLDAAKVNVQRYSLGLDPSSSSRRGAETPDGSGANGELPGADELKGAQRNKTGIFALEDADIFNLLCIPRTASLSATAASAVLTQALDYCEENRAFMVVDPPKDKNEPEEIREWISSGWGAGHRHDHGAVYFPRVRIPDPEEEFRPREVSPSGTVAGLYARTDTERGVWKAPAGTEATLQGVQSLEYNLSNQENGLLNPLGVNCLRTFPTYGTVSWGGRTLRGADQLADEYKYVPVRRTALYIEQSLFRGLQWVVFEPNDESLWAQIRTSVQGFMQNLFRKGAFQGTSPKEAYFVKCDSETTTQADIDRGIVNLVVGFAPLKPAEFVILKIKQMAGQEQ